MLARRAGSRCWGVVASGLLVLAGCETGAGPDERELRIAVRPVFSAAAGIVDIAQTRVRLSGPDETLLIDSLVAVAAGADSLELVLRVPGGSAADVFMLSLDFITSTGEVAFRAGPLAVRPSAGAAPVAVDVQATYVGTGANAVSVRITPRSGSMSPGGSQTVTAAALDGQGQPIPGTPIAWSSLDPTRVTVPDPRVGTLLAGTQTGSARIVASLLTGPADTITVLVFGTGSLSWIFHASGISDFIPGDSLDSGRFLELVDPVARTIVPLVSQWANEEVVGLAYDPTRNRVFATNRDCDLYSIDPANGAETLVGNTSDPQGGFCGGTTDYLKGLAFNPATGRLLAGTPAEFSDPLLYDLDQATAVMTPLGAVTTTVGDTLDGYHGLAFHPSGMLYGVVHRAGDALRDRYLATIDLSTRVATLIALLSQNGVAGFTVTSDGTLYAVTGDGANVPESLWTVNPTTAVLTLVMALGNGDDGEAITAVPPQF